LINPSSNRPEPYANSPPADHLPYAGRSVDGGPFLPLNPPWEYASEAVAQLEADRLNALEPPAS
jgi:hypothetical protein